MDDDSLHFFFFFNDTATTEIYTLSLHDALPISGENERIETDEAQPQQADRGSAGRTQPRLEVHGGKQRGEVMPLQGSDRERSEEHTSELQSRQYLVCRLLLEKKKKHNNASIYTA